ncbi:hypothetical protein OH77DRAFT_640297 [Trametes cingulata]|nr:hypothetical protein OH77DRAFT_640297 [Trametes cingulata]
MPVPQESLDTTLEAPDYAPRRGLPCRGNVYIPTGDIAKRVVCIYLGAKSAIITRETALRLSVYLTHRLRSCSILPLRRLIAGKLSVNNERSCTLATRNHGLFSKLLGTGSVRAHISEEHYQRLRAGEAPWLVRAVIPCCATLPRRRRPSAGFPFVRQPWKVSIDKVQASE